MDTKILRVVVILVLLAVSFLVGLFWSDLTGWLDSKAKVTTLKDAKLNIEHNATDEDTGFQGFIDSEGWQNLTVTGPNGKVLKIEGQQGLGNLGLTELFFETVEPANADISIKDMLKVFPAGNYVIQGSTIEAGERKGWTKGSALLTHDIPAGPELLTPREKEVVSTKDGLFVSWGPVTETIEGKDIEIISYQLIIEKDAEPHRHMIGNLNSLSMYLPNTTTSITIPAVFFQSDTKYKWEVLAVEKSGNQTLSSGEFSTK